MDDWKPASFPALHTRRTYVVDQLREAILRGFYMPGDRLDQGDIATLFNVSRSPVRSALVLLEAEGLVHNEPHRGAVVAELSRTELEEIYLIRGVLEGIAARLGAPALTEPQLVDMRLLFSRLDESPAPDLYARLNNEFHNIIYAAAHRPRLFSIIKTLTNTALPYTRQYFMSADHHRTARVGHVAVLEACEARDGKAAQAATEAHLATVWAEMAQQWSAAGVHNGRGDSPLAPLPPHQEGSSQDS
jgi:DNA-binding GntR family transcriptional regulator